MSDATIVKKIKDFATGQEIRDAIGVSEGGGMGSSTKFDAIQYLWNGKTYIVIVSALYSISWATLNTKSLVRGKNIILNGFRYKIRLMKGSEEDTVVDDSKIITPNTEYYQFIKTNRTQIAELANGGLLTNSSYHFIMQELRGTDNCLLCKFVNSTTTDNTTTWTITHKNSSDSNYHAVFVLEPLSPSIDIGTTNLGDIFGDDNSINFTAISPNGSEIHTVIQINGNIIDSVDTSSGIQSHYTITSKQLESLSYGKHKISFLPGYVDNSGETITGEEKFVSFNKVKKLNQPLFNANLGKLVNQINLISEDMDYQLLRLNQELSNVGITIEDGSNLASIVNVLRDKGSQVKRWASGTSVTPSTTTNVRIDNLGFKPSVIFTYLLYDGTFGSYAQNYTFNPNNTKQETFLVSSSGGGSRYSRDIDETKVYNGGFNLDIGYTTSHYNKEFRWIAYE